MPDTFTTDVANKEHLDAFLRGVEQWNRWRNTHPYVLPILANQDFRRMDLREADLSNTVLRRSNLSDANLTGANLYQAEMYGADLRRASLVEADLRGAKLHNTDLRDANLVGTDLYRVDSSGHAWTVLSLRRLGARRLRSAMLISVTLPGWKRSITPDRAAWTLRPYSALRQPCRGCS